jgi:hypothetical protein
MASRQQAVNSRRVQFVFLILLVVAAVVMLASSGLAAGSVLGISMKAVYGFVGMVLVVVVAIAGQKTLFSNIPDEESAYERDVMSKAEGVASEKGLGRLAQIKYGKRRERDKEVPFEGMFKRKGE